MISENTMAIVNWSGTCAHCGQDFQPRIKHGPNRDRFCSAQCKDRYHNSRRYTNPIETGDPFRLTLTNPNPKIRKPKSGDRFTVEFEVTKEQFDHFVGVKRKGLVIEAECRVIKRGER